MMEGSNTGRPASMMSFMDAMKGGVSKSFKLEGRASRSEYWWLYLGYMLTFLLSSILAGAVHGIFMILPLLLVPAMITASIRRMHDIGKSGWMTLCFVIPIVGMVLVILWFMADAGQPEDNAYGAVPTNMLE
jgi:uncharacterized membrane protein YhaH (DUF805 family)